MNCTENKTSTKSKIAIALLAVAGVLAGVLAPLASVKAADTVGPRFNVLPDDYKTLRGGNKTNNELSRNAVVTGVAGDTVSGLVYYHNGVLNTTANNTKVKVTFPAQTTNKKATVSVNLSADNAENVINDTMEIQLDQDAKLTFVSGSVQWMPNFTDTTKPAVALPNGQTGNEIITPAGVNLGGINGCWNYIGYVYFLVKTDKIEAKLPALKIEKTVRDFTVNEATFVKENEAKPGDVLEYKISYSNTGEGPAANVTVSDVLPANVTYLANTTVLNDGTGEKMVADGIAQSGISLGAIANGTTGYVKFKATISSSVAANQTLTNTGYLLFNKQNLSDTAKTKIVVNVIVTPGQPGAGNPLPQTGAETYIITALIVAAGYVTAKYLKKRKELAQLIK